MKKGIVFILFPIVLFSCKKEESLPEYNVDPVVTAYLSPGVEFSLLLAHQQSTSSETFSSPSLDSLDITITTNDTVYHLVSKGYGVYTDSTLILRAGYKYDLQFIYNGKVVTASTVIPTKPTDVTQSVTEISIEHITSSTTTTFPSGPADPVTLTWSNNDASYYLVVAQNIEKNPVRIIDTTSALSDTTLIFRNKPTVSASDDINTRSFTYFGKHRIVLFHINPDYASLYDNNSSNSQNLSTPSTGITNGVGIFTGINSDTLFLQVDKK